ncbi:unnamed protein product [Ixodes hexagonus]
MSASNRSLLDCSLVNKLANDGEARCLLLQGLDDCDAGRALLPYIDFLYCWPKWGYWPLALLVLWLVTLLVALGSTASSYLCPALVVISKSLQLSQSVTGVTLLAFGNGAPDTIATIASIRHNRTALAIGELFGGGTYVATVVVGLVFISNDFDVIQFSLLRDIIFYLAASYWAFLLYFHGYITVIHAAGFIALYIVYLVVAIFGPSVITKCIQARLRIASNGSENLPDNATDNASETTDHSSGDALLAEADDIVAIPVPFVQRPRLRRSSSGVSLHHHHENAIHFFTASVEESGARSLRGSPRSSHGASARHGSSSTSSGEATPLLGRSTEQRAEYSQWKELLLQLSPIEPREWNTKPLWSKLFDMLTLPIHLALVLTVPVVDPENRLANWCRPLNALQCITSPLLTLGLFRAFFDRLGGLVPLWTIALTMGLLLATALLSTSAAHEPPSYHCGFAYAGFIVSVLWIYGIATEIVALLKTFGVFYGISDVLLGMTVLAWGNNIGDLVTNLSLAKQGFPQMAMSACFAGPVLALLLGIGIAFNMNFASLSLEVIKLQYSRLLLVVYIVLVGMMLLLLLSMVVTWFRSSRFVGIMLITLYVTFLLFTFLVEFTDLSTAIMSFSFFHRQET